MTTRSQAFSPNWAIHAVNTGEPDLAPMYAIASGDGYGFLVGELSEVESLIDRLAQFIITEQHDGEIHDTDEILGHPHYSAYEAAKEFDVPVSTITKACRDGRIHHARREGRAWRFPQRTFVAWMAQRQKAPGRPRNS